MDRVIDRSTMSTGTAVRGLGVGATGFGILFAVTGALNAEAPSEPLANPVLAKADLIVGPATEAAKLGLNTALDYSVLTASATVVNYFEVHREIRGQRPNQTVVTTSRRHFIDSSDGKSVHQTTVVTLYSNGVMKKTPADPENFYHGVGSLEWHCDAYDSNKKFVARSELVVEPTELRVRVDAGKYSGASLKFPKRVSVQLDGAGVGYETCDYGGNPKTWSYQLSARPLQDTAVFFNGRNQIVSYPLSVQIGYAKPAK